MFGLQRTIALKNNDNKQAKKLYKIKSLYVYLLVIMNLNVELFFREIQFK